MNTYTVFANPDFPEMKVEGDYATLDFGTNLLTIRKNDEPVAIFKHWEHYTVENNSVDKAIDVYKIKLYEVERISRTQKESIEYLQKQNEELKDQNDAATKKIRDLKSTLKMAYNTIYGKSYTMR